MALIDSHAHLTSPELAGQVEAVLERCAAAGVERVITIGTDLEDARAGLALCSRFPRQISLAAGFHPHNAERVTDEALAVMAEVWCDPRVVALGEMGLDYHYDFAPRQKQRQVFARQLELAAGRGVEGVGPLAVPSAPAGARASESTRETLAIEQEVRPALRPVDKPIIIHCREAFDDCVPILLDHGYGGRRVVFHCFSGTEKEACVVAEHGWRISFTGIVTFPRSTELQAIARAYPAERLMVETDAPYLSPVPMRGRKPNEPAWVVHVARFLAELRGEPFEALVKQTHENTRQFFGLEG